MSGLRSYGLVMTPELHPVHTFLIGAAITVTVVAVVVIGDVEFGNAIDARNASTSASKTAHLPNDPGLGRQLTDWRDVSAEAREYGTFTARFCDPATKDV